MKLNNSDNAVTAEQDTERILGYIGRSKKAGALITGSAAVCDEIRKKRSGCAVFYAADSSEPTKKKLCDKCAYYNVRIAMLNTTAAELAHRVGKTGAVAAVMITNAGLADTAFALTEPADGERNEKPSEQPHGNIEAQH